MSVRGLMRRFALVLSVAATVLTATPVEPAVAFPPAPVAPPVWTAGPAAPDPVCAALFSGLARPDQVRADAIMEGRVDLGRYGTFVLTANPAWRSQRTLDLAGNRYQSSLHWALPLLQTGVALGSVTGRAYVDRFLFLLRDWDRDHPTRTRSVWVDHPQYGGLRLGTFVCAMRELAGHPAMPWLRGQAAVELTRQLRVFRATGNNTMLTSAMTAYAAAKTLRSRTGEPLAAAHIRTLLPRLLNPDGSDREGAPGYGVYAATLAARSADVARALGDPYTASLFRNFLARSASFVAQASRPDRVLETIGDTSITPMPTTLYGPASPATWVAAGGVGTAPVPVYSSWQGGYAFGRSRWVSGVDDESTFYSVRTGRTTPNSPHRHSDTTALTYFTRGVSWVASPGPYRYDSSRLRGFVRSRAAHSALLAPGRPAFSAPAAGIVANSRSGVDTTCLRDPAYENTSGVQLARCVYYVRALDALVVADFARPTSPRALTARVTAQFVVPADVGTTNGTTGEMALHSKADPTRQVVITTSGTWARSGLTPPTRGLGRTYGVAQPATVVRSSWAAPRGRTSAIVTVLAPTPATVTRSGAQLLVTVDGRTATVDQPFTAFPRPRATISLSTSIGRTRVIARGTAAAAGSPIAGVRIVLQRRHGHGWRSISYARTSARGTYAFPLTRSAASVESIRLVLGGRSGTLGWTAGRSRTAVIPRAAKHR